MASTDPRALRALAHPLRLDLIELLAVRGRATAAACARELGHSQASCSFHLRQLAKYGFVEEAPPGPDRRERHWRLTDLRQRWSSDDPAAAELEKVFIEREAGRLLDWVDHHGTEPAEWRDAASLGGMSLPLTAAELADVNRRLREVLEPYVERLTDPATRPPGSRLVRMLLAATPLSIRLDPDSATDTAPPPEETPS
ncbi:helix-turn-helix protein [Stackebrandtia albiflava]|uniref:Helix-turn-helix protein n=1 Tax=Stackebrandtia albiflava TaxID=406432 RepID=A0A562V4X7_9ACTN|nr:winged helix-turn-helix domain-containing protein [Stackebrandtia albiflava]TWJ12944.1 helix-turn-helix protein [Stackebrandtia albiflava]